ncbi:Hypothetical protein, predicted transmembrane protein [Mycoplasma yeatsii 13926]|uniref:Transmembrane protein n=1 Tax=Mycoplasma yeatsii 13926 TaxID=1188240 RepID=S6G3P4_9MOLU|nr:hypothetical protein [Mycoplasma yeatsii]EOA07396.1 Hypothetical protein, predicted transmembrane protein [Mycoplasma yeatsii 13926]
MLKMRKVLVGATACAAVMTGSILANNSTSILNSKDRMEEKYWQNVNLSQLKNKSEIAKFIKYNNVAKKDDVRTKTDYQAGADQVMDALNKTTFNNGDNINSSSDKWTKNTAKKAIAKAISKSALKATSDNLTINKTINKAIDQVEDKTNKSLEDTSIFSKDEVSYISQKYFRVAMNDDDNADAISTQYDLNVSYDDTYKTAVEKMQDYVIQHEKAQGRKADITISLKDQSLADKVLFDSNKDSYLDLANNKIADQIEITISSNGVSRDDVFGLKNINLVSSKKSVLGETQSSSDVFAKTVDAMFSSQNSVEISHDIDTSHSLEDVFNSYSNMITNRIKQKVSLVRNNLSSVNDDSIYKIKVDTSSINGLDITKSMYENQELLSKIFNREVELPIQLINTQTNQVVSKGVFNPKIQMDLISFFECMDSIEGSSDGSLPTKINLLGAKQTYNTDTTIANMETYWNKVLNQLVGDYSFKVTYDKNKDLNTKLQAQMSDSTPFDKTQFKDDGIQIGYTTTKGAYRVISDSNALLQGVTPSPTVEKAMHFKKEYSKFFDSLYATRDVLKYFIAGGVALTIAEGALTIAEWSEMDAFDASVTTAITCMAAAITVISAIAMSKINKALDEANKAENVDVSKIDNFDNYKASVMKYFDEVAHWSSVMQYVSIVMTISTAAVYPFRSAIKDKLAKLREAAEVVEGAEKADPSWLVKYNVELIATIFTGATIAWGNAINSFGQGYFALDIAGDE